MSIIKDNYVPKAIILHNNKEYTVNGEINYDNIKKTLNEENDKKKELKIPGTRLIESIKQNRKDLIVKPDKIKILKKEKRSIVLVIFYKLNRKQIY